MRPRADERQDHERFDLRAARNLELRSAGTPRRAASAAPPAAGERLARRRSPCTRSMASRHQPHSTAATIRCAAAVRRRPPPTPVRSVIDAFAPGQRERRDIGQERNGEPDQLARRRLEFSEPDSATLARARKAERSVRALRRRRARRAPRPARRRSSAWRFACCASRYRSTKTLTLVRRISGNDRRQDVVDGARASNPWPMRTSSA